MPPKENSSKLSTRLQAAGFGSHASFIARIKASRRLKTTYAQSPEALDVGAVAAALSTAEREITTAADPGDMLDSTHAAVRAHQNQPLAPPSAEEFAQLHNDKVAAETIHKTQARAVRSAKRQADYARLMLTRALDNFGASAHHAENEALKAAIDYESACSAALTQAHEEHVASVAALGRAQEAYHSALHRAPREALAAHISGATHTPVVQEDTEAHDGWLDDAVLKQLRWIPALEE